MKIIRASHLGMCFGVQDAIALAHETAAEQPLSILGELVHNETVLEELKARGVQIASTLEEAQHNTVMITAHGASRKSILSAISNGKEVLEATCPLVQMAHTSLLQLIRAGFHPVIIGKRDHVEVKGMTGDLNEFDVVLSESDVLDLPERERFGVVAQTTQPIERVHFLVALLRWRFPDAHVVFRDTVCQPTKLRQSSAIELARRCDVVIVIGGRHSNNTRELARTCSKYCNQVCQVESAADLNEACLELAEVVGITAGTSTPDSIIDAVEASLREMSKRVDVRSTSTAIAAGNWAR